MSDSYRYIPNSTYTGTKQREEQLARDCQLANQRIIDAKQRLSRIERELSTQVGIDRKELDRKLNREMDRLLAGLGSLDEKLRLELGRQNVQYRQQLDAVRQDLHNVNGRVTQVGQRISDLAEQFSTRITAIMSGIEDRKVRAQAYISQLSLLLEQIAELHPDKLAPGEYDLLSDILTSARTDITVGDYNVAIGLAQTHIPAATALRTRLEILNDEFSQLIVQLHDRCNEVSRRIQDFRDPPKNRQILTVKDPPKSSIETAEFDGRIPFWSSGVFDAIVDRYEQICNDIETNYAVEMDLDALRRSLGDMDSITQDLDECLSFAHREYLEFVGVVSLVSRIHQALTANDTWNIAGCSGFAGGDERRSYSVSYENGAKLTATFVVMPTHELSTRDQRGRVRVERRDTQFRIDVFQPDGIEDDALCRLTRRGVLARLEDEKIDIGTNADMQTALSNTSAEFIEASLKDGDKIKDGRIVDIKGRLKI